MAFDTSKLQKILDLPTFDWESLNPIPAASAAGSFVRSQNVDAYNIRANFFAVNTTSSIWFYDPETDTCQLLPASGMSGTFAAGACGRARPFGPSGTATAGSTTTLTTNLTITRGLRGMFIRITGGPGAGDVRKIASNTVGSNSVITVTAAFSATITASSTYQLLTPRLYVLNPHTASPWLYMRYYDWALNTWSADQAIPAGLAAAWGTDAQLCGTHSIFGNALDSSNRKVFGSATTTVLTLTSGALWTVNQWTGGVITITAGTGAGQVRAIASNTAATLTVDTAWGVTPDATSEYIIEKAFESSRGKTFGSATTTVMTLSAGASWTTNQWANSQIRILSGTGAGQVRAIASNTSLTLTVGTAWTTAPNATSVWLIEGNDDYLYLTGNNATAFYRYTISSNAWTTMTARGGAAAAGCSLSWVYGVSDSSWTNPNVIQNGRYLYSFRGGATTLDRYDIAAGTWTSGLTYGGSGETFGTGTTHEYDDRDNLIIATAGSTSLPARLLRFDLIRTALFPMGTVPRIQGTAVAGDKLFNIQFYADTGKRIDYIYHWRNSGQELCRAPIWYVY